MSDTDDDTLTISYLQAKRAKRAAEEAAAAASKGESEDSESESKDAASGGERTLALQRTGTGAGISESETQLQRAALASAACLAIAGVMQYFAHQRHANYELEVAQLQECSGNLKRLLSDYVACAKQEGLIFCEDLVQDEPRSCPEVTPVTLATKVLTGVGTAGIALGVGGGIVNGPKWLRQRWANQKRRKAEKRADEAEQREATKRAAEAKLREERGVIATVPPVNDRQLIEATHISETQITNAIQQLLDGEDSTLNSKSFTSSMKSPITTFFKSINATFETYISKCTDKFLGIWPARQNKLILNIINGLLRQRKIDYQTFADDDGMTNDAQVVKWINHNRGHDIIDDAKRELIDREWKAMQIALKSAITDEKLDMNRGKTPIAVHAMYVAAMGLFQLIAHQSYVKQQNGKWEYVEVDTTKLSDTFKLSNNFDILTTAGLSSGIMFMQLGPQGLKIASCLALAFYLLRIGADYMEVFSKLSRAVVENFDYVFHKGSYIMFQGLVFAIILTVAREIYRQSKMSDHETQFRIQNALKRKLQENQKRIKSGDVQPVEIKIPHGFAQALEQDLHAMLSPM